MQRSVSIVRNLSVIPAAFLVAILTLAQSLAGQTGPTYYVSTSGNDANPGTLAVPWRHIQHAASTVTAGATVYVMGGVYNEFVSFPNSGTAGSPITIESYPGQTAILDGTGLTVSGTQCLISISGARSYITVGGFEIRNLSSSKGLPCGVLYSGSGTGVQILNNLVHNINALPTGNGGGILVYGTSQTPINQVVVSGNELYNLQTGTTESLTVAGNVTNFQVTNNLVHDNDNIGIDVAGYWNHGPVGYDQPIYGVVSGNTIYNISGIGSAAQEEEYDADGIYCDGCGFMTFERNVVFQVDYGIETTSENQICQANGTEWPGAYGVGTPAKGKLPCYGMDATVRNNLFYYENACGNSIGGYAQMTSKGGAGNGGGGSFDDVFVNNTLYDNGTQPGNDSEGTPSGDFQTQNQVGSAQGNIFENNVIYESAASPYSTSPNMWINSYAASSTAYPAPPATLNWNLYDSVAGYVEGTSILWADVGTYTSFANWQATNVGGEDANSLNTDPFFVHIADTPPNFATNTNSPAIGAASSSLSCSVGWCDPHGSSPTSIYGSTDFLGNPRTNTSTGAIDIGAYQNTGAPLSNSLAVNLTAGTYTLAPGQSTTLAVTVLAIPGGGGVPSGTVNYMLGANMLATQTLLPTSTTTSAASMPISASQLAQGGNSITAVYSGNSIAPCCTPALPPGGSQTPVPWYPSTNSAPITMTFSGSPGIYSPVNNASLTSAPVVFQWFGYPSATAYWLDVGREQGGNEYYQSGGLSSSTTSQSVSALPTDGSAIWARWYYLLGGTWQFIDYSYTAMGGSSSKGVITTPVPSTVLTSTSVAFTWTPGTGATAYWIDIGSSAGGSQYYQSGNLGNTITATVPGLPANGGPLYVTLYSMIGGQWFGNGYTYTAVGGAATLATITSPTSGASLCSSCATFSWTAGTPTPVAYWIDVGSTPGGNNYYQSKSLSNATTSATVCGLPTNGSEIFVTLYTEISNSPVTWQGNAYTFYGTNLSTITSPANGDPDLSGIQATFSWTNANPSCSDTYALDISAIAPGGNDVWQSGNLGDVFSTTNPLSNPLPDTNPGTTIYLTLYTINGSAALGSSHVTYTSGP